jgi:hypothetical protein
MIFLKATVLIKSDHDFTDDEIKKYITDDDAHLLLHSNKLGATIGTVEIELKDKRTFKHLTED